jgi:hypothetical protein
VGGCRPEASAEGSPWGRRPERSVLWDAVPSVSEGCLANAPFFMSPRAEARGPSALACLGRTKKDARKDKVGNFLGQPLPPLDYFIPNYIK